MLIYKISISTGYTQYRVEQKIAKHVTWLVATQYRLFKEGLSHHSTQTGEPSVICHQKPQGYSPGFKPRSARCFQWPSANLNQPPWHLAGTRLLAVINTSNLTHIPPLPSVLRASYLFSSFEHNHNNDLWGKYKVLMPRRNISTTPQELTSGDSVINPVCLLEKLRTAFSISTFIYFGQPSLKLKM